MMIIKRFDCNICTNIDNRKRFVFTHPFQWVLILLMNWIVLLQTLHCHVKCLSSQKNIFGNMGNVCHVAKYQNSQHPLNDIWPIRQIELKILKKKCLRITMSMLTNLTCLSTPAKSTPSIEWELFQANELSFSQGLVPFIKVKSTNSKQEILIYMAKHIKVQLEMETLYGYP